MIRGFAATGFGARLTVAGLFLAPVAGMAAPGDPCVRLETSAGPIVVEVALKQAPVTAGNFLRYVDAGRLDGTTFYRAARSRVNPKEGLVQGGINHNVRVAFNPIAHEPTTRTGLKHGDGTLSMARNAPGTAMGDFFVTVGATSSSYLDAAPGRPGYAAFGRVVAGMPIVHRILAGATFPGGFSEMTIGQTLRAPVRIVRARRVK